MIRFVSNLILLVFFFLSLAVLDGRSRTINGTDGERNLTLQTEILESGEYAQAYQLLPYFEGRYNYDVLSGTLIFHRPDSVRVGLQVGEERVVIGDRVIHTGDPLVRKRGRIYIPLYVVDTYLLPRVRFGETTTATPAPTPAPTASGDSVLKGNVFVYPTIARQTPTAQPTPTQGRYIFRQPSPSPTPAGVDHTIPYAPSAVIVLDPGHDDTNPGHISVTGMRECDVTLAVCEKLAANLEDHNRFQVNVTRGGEATTLNTEQRVAIANRSKGTVFVSVHCGALFTPAVSRGAVYYMNNNYDGALPGLSPFPGDHLIPWDSAYRRFVVASSQLAKAVNRQLVDFYSIA
ncbi:hypothetical protein GF373_16360, partial [bacterium]|nr:hypothetical protein [bacterium]